jgi:hypothetical protein
MPHVVLVLGRDEARVGRRPREAALERAVCAAAGVVVLADERPVAVRLGVERGELAA